MSEKAIYSRIQRLKNMSCGFRNRERFRRVILFHLGGIKRFALWPLRGETILSSVIGQITKMRRRYSLSL